MALKVFFSYSWADSSSMEKILEKICELKNVEVIIDKSSIPPGALIHPGIAGMIRSADIVVCNLTENASKSPEVIEEMALSNEFGKKLLALVRTDKNLKVPWFLRENNTIQYKEDSFQQAIDILIGEIRHQSSELGKFRKFAMLLFKEKFTLRTALMLAILSNVGVLTWWATNKLLGADFLSRGNYLLQLILNSKEEFKGLWPSIWALTGGWSPIIAALLFFKAKYGAISRRDLNWIYQISWFLIVHIIISTIYYNSGYDDFLKESIRNDRIKEIISTMGWIGFHSSAIILIFYMLNIYLWNELKINILLGSIFASIATGVIFLIVYFLLPQNDMIRGLVMGIGIRTGLFIGLMIPLNSIQIGPSYCDKFFTLSKSA